MSEELDDFYKNYYQKTQYTGAMGMFHNFYHKRLENTHASNMSLDILEVGAGFAEHLKFVKRDFHRYVLSDLHLDNENQILKKNLLDLELSSDSRIEYVACDIQDMPFKDSEFDRLIITCVLHHVTNLEAALKEIRRVTKNNGRISVYIPCDPGLTYRIIRHFASHRKQAKIMGAPMSYIKYIWSLEHVNHFGGIVSKIMWVFRSDDLMWSGRLGKFLNYDFAIFKVLEIVVRK